MNQGQSLVGHRNLYAFQFMFHTFNNSKLPSICKIWPKHYFSVTTYAIPIKFKQ